MDDHLAYCMETGEDVLTHYGIQGMKWGVRRYQNPDGSLTAAGRERYGVGMSEEGSSDKINVAKAAKYSAIGGAALMTVVNLDNVAYIAALATSGAPFLGSALSLLGFVSVRSLGFGAAGGAYALLKNTVSTAVDSTVDAIDKQISRKQSNNR